MRCQGLVALCLLAVPTVGDASYAQFCRLEGQVTEAPVENGRGITFRYEVTRAVAYEDKLWGEGWGDCDAHVGETIDVFLADDYRGDAQIEVGLTLVLWRDAMDMEVNGEMCTFVGFSAVEPE